MADLIDYDGKLNYHTNYLRMLKILENKCNYIAIALKNEIVDEFKNDIIKTEKTSSWWATKSSLVIDVFYIKSSKGLFNYLKKYDTFCKYYYGDISKGVGDTNFTTDFGNSDIAFYDKNNNILLCTTTHEGYISVSKEIDKEFNKKGNNTDTILNRISLNENRFIDIAKSMGDLRSALDMFMLQKKELKKLNKYYGSKNWFKDKELFEKNHIPRINAGVLSEDTIWFLNENIDELLEYMKSIVDEYKKQ